jgi:hypothetical protein
MPGLSTTRISKMKKISKTQLQRIIREEKEKLLNEDSNAGMNALILIDAIRFAVEDSLDGELGLRPDELDSTLAALLEPARQREIIRSIQEAFTAHRKKLDMMGGKPKPRTV